MDYTEKTLTRERAYDGSIISVDKLTVTLPNGKVANRDLIVHPGASVVLPIDDDGSIYMVSQYRKPIEKVSMEVPAGKLDENEDPLVCAKRELLEETGLTCSEIKHVYSMHTTPAFCDEVLHFYVATGLKKGKANPDEDEFLHCEKKSLQDLTKLIFNGTITDVKTIVAIQLAMLIEKEIVSI